MDKSYLLHNLKIVDNAEEDHGMLDLEFQNIHYEGRDLIADVIETTRYIGEVNPSIFTTKYENVSLTGAGGGSHTDEVTITFKNELESGTIPVALFEEFGSGSPKWNLDIAAGTTETRTATVGEAILVQSSIDNIVHSGVTVLQSGQTTCAFGLVSSVANFTFNTGEK